MGKSKWLRFFGVQTSSKSSDNKNISVEEVETWPILRIASKDIDVSASKDSTLEDDSSQGEDLSYAGEVGIWEPLSKVVLRTVIASVVLGILVIGIGVGLCLLLFHGNPWLLVLIATFGLKHLVKGMSGYYFHSLPNRLSKYTARHQPKRK
jgi:hypothetical protein